MLMTPSKTRPTDPTTGLGESDLRRCVRDLVAISTMPTWWIDRSPSAIAESVRDLLVTMLRAEVGYVQVRLPSTEKSLVAVIGITQDEVESALAGTADNLFEVVPGQPRRPLRFTTSPIGLNGELGCVAAGSSRPEFPNEIETLLLRVTANQVAVALRHTALLDRHRAGEQLLSERMAQQAAVAQIGLRALGGSPIEVLLEAAVDAVCSTLGVDFCEVLELTPDRTALILRSGAGWKPGTVGSARVTASRESQAGYTLAVAQPVLVDDLGKETRFIVPAVLSEHGAISGITVIIHDHNQPFGVLGAYTRQLREFSQDDINFLQAIANLLATSLQGREVEAQREDLLFRLQRAVAARDRAVGVVSHDLGNPLSTIQICATALLDPAPTPMEGIRRMAEIIQRSAAWMQQILHDLVDRVSLDSGHLVLERRAVGVAQVVETAQVMFTPVAAEHGVRLVIETQPWLPAIDADPNRLLQVLSNLLGNAIKFTPSDGCVTLRTAEDLSGPDTVGSRLIRFQVSDTGPGIPADDLPHVFDWFWHSRRKGGGSGLGLAIAKGLVDAHNSRLYVESSPGQGSKFWFTLPVANSSAEELSS